MFMEFLGSLRAPMCKGCCGNVTDVWWDKPQGAHGYKRKEKMLSSGTGVEDMENCTNQHNN